jgi:hypothetical protein
MLAISEQDLQFSVVFIVKDFAFFPVAALEETTPSFFVQIPFFDVLADVHAVGSQDVEYVHDGEATGEVEHGDVEVYPDLGEKGGEGGRNEREGTTTPSKRTGDGDRTVLLVLRTERARASLQQAEGAREGRRERWREGGARERRRTI